MSETRSFVMLPGGTSTSTRCRPRRSNQQYREISSSKCEQWTRKEDFLREYQKRENGKMLGTTSPGKRWHKYLGMLYAKQLRLCNRTFIRSILPCMLLHIHPPCTTLMAEQLLSFGNIQCQAWIPWQWTMKRGVLPYLE